MSNALSGVASIIQFGNATSTTSIQPQRIDEHTVKIVSDSGQGIQKAGQTFGAISAKMGNRIKNGAPWRGYRTAHPTYRPSRSTSPAKARPGSSGKT